MKSSLFKRILLFCAFAVAVGVFAVYECWPSQPVGERLTSWFIGMPVTFGRATIAWGDPVTVTLDDVHVANKSWGTVPDILSAGHIDAGLDRTALMHGKTKFVHLVIDDALLTLERDTDGKGNWRRSHRLRLPSSKTAKEEASRESLPTILSLNIHRSRIVFRLHSGSDLKIDFKDLNLQTPDIDQPVRMSVKGEYNETPVDIDIQADSFEKLRDVDQPFQATVRAQGASTTIDLVAGLMDPLNFDDIDGKIKITVHQIGRMAGLLGAPFSYNVPLTISGTFKRQGDYWSLQDANGELGKNSFKSSRIELDEGTRREPDSVATDVNFDDLQVVTLMPYGDGTKPQKGEAQDPFLDFSHEPGTLLHANVTAKKVSFQRLNGDRLAITGIIEKEAIGLKSIALDIMGGRTRGSLIARPEQSSDGKAQQTVINGDLTVDKIDAAQLVQFINRDKSMVEGRLDLKGEFEARGSTRAEIAKTTQGFIAASAIDGRLSKKIARLASTDLTAFFESNQDTTTLKCVAAVMHIDHGTGTFDPFVIKTGAGTFTVKGGLNLNAATVNVTMAPDPKSTSGLALDIPFHVTGSITKPSVTPLMGSKERDVLLQTASAPHHPAWVERMETSNPCFAGVNKSP